MTTTLPAYLPLSDGLHTTLYMLRDGDSAYINKAAITRACTLGLAERVQGAEPQLTALGQIVAAVAADHGYSTSYAHPGRIGVKGRCRCGEWTWSTNEKGANGQRRVRSAHAAHLAAEIAKREAGA